MKKSIVLFLFLFLFFFTINAQKTETMQTFESEVLKRDSSDIKDSEKLVVLWTSGDPEVAKKMVFMYTYNAQKNE